MAGEFKPSTIRGELELRGPSLWNRRQPVQQLYYRPFARRCALNALQSAGAAEKQIEIVRVPGSFEIPIAAKKLAASNRFDSIICVGCVLRGETSHYDVVVSETARGIQLAQLDSGVAHDSLRAHLRHSRTSYQSRWPEKWK